MIWSDRDIRNGLSEGSIRIEPFDLQALQPASVDLRLGNVFYRFRKLFATKCIDTRESVRQHMIRFEPQKGGIIIIYPQDFLLGATHEKISLGNNVVARIEGKSSLARLGLTVHSTGGFIDPGNQDLNVTLEMVNHSPVAIRLYVGMYIAQVAFENTLSVCERPYGPERGSRYYADSEPVPSRVNERHSPSQTSGAIQGKVYPQLGPKERAGNPAAPAFGYRKRLFTEDECLRNDPNYPGIRGWWAEKFPGRVFESDWSSAKDTEVDGGDSFSRAILIDGISYEVIYSFDGYSASQL